MPILKHHHHLIMKLFQRIEKNIINVSIYFIFIFIISSSVLDYYYRLIYEDHERIEREVKEAKAAMEGMLSTINLVDLGFRGFYIIPNDGLLDPYHIGVKQLPETIKKVKAAMENHGMDVKEFVPVEIAFNDYFKLMEELVEWRKEGKMAAIDSVIALDHGLGVWQQYDKVNQKFQAKEDAILAESKAKAEKIIAITTIVRILLLVLVVPTLLSVLYRLRKEGERRLKLFLELDKNNKQYLFDEKSQAEDELDEKKVIATLINNLKRAADFISNIARGNYEVKWEGMTEQNREANKENLAGELWRMREQMIRVKEEDAIRLWMTEGISKFSEIVRRYQDDMTVLSDQLTSNVVRYLKANQASLFFAVEREGEVTLELFGCYAYDRKKYLEKSFGPGQGLVGQAYLEKSIVHLKQIPQNYIQITSGLGGATPNSLIIVPLKFNDKVEGVLELASFNAFEQYEIDFLEKVGEIVASAIVYIQASAKMKEVMSSMQLQSEEMKNQEEEMRQNMEELQATQEEILRKAQEYQSVILEKDKTIEKYQQEIVALKKQLEQA